MKKFILSLGLVAMMLNLTNCAQYEDVNPTVEPQGDFALYASVSRTANDGLNTVWSAGDEINVFHAVTDATTYSNDGKFSLNDVATGRFLGTLNGTLDVEEEYDWYAFYPYSSYIKTPANVSSGYMPVGCKSNEVQTQTGNNSMAHLAGPNYPLAGVAKAVGAGVAPTIVMNNLTSVLEFEVKNALEEAITVSEITFTAPEDIVGTYYINFVDLNNVVYTGSGSSYVSNTATLKVEEGTAIAAGSSAKFYLAVKPFTAEAGSDLTLNVTATVDGNEFVYTKAINVAKATSFVAGAIKPVVVNYNVELPSEEDIFETIDFSKQGYANATAITSYEGTYCNIAFAKGSNSSNDPKYYTAGTAVRCYGGNFFTLTSAMNIVKVEFTFDSGESSNAITADSGAFTDGVWTGSANSVKFTIGGTSGHRRIQKLVIYYGEAQPMIIPTAPATVAYNATTATINYELLVVSGTVTATENVDWITAVDCSTEGKVVLTLTENSEYANRTADVTLSKEGAEDVVVEVTQSAKPRPEINATSPVSVDATETTATITYTLANTTATTVTATENVDWITAVDCSAAGKVVLTLTENSTSESRQAEVTLSCTDAEDKKVMVIQAAAGASADPVTADLSFANKAQRTAFTTTSQTWEQNGITFVNDKSSSTNNVADYANPVRLYASSKVTVTAPGNITKIEFTANSSSYATALKNSIGTVSGATVSVSGSVVTITYSASVESVVIAKLAAQVRLNSLSVTYIP